MKQFEPYSLIVEERRDGASVFERQTRTVGADLTCLSDRVRLTRSVTSGAPRILGP